MIRGTWLPIFLCFLCTMAVSQEWQPFLSIPDPHFDISSNFGEEVQIHGDTLAVSAPGGFGAVHLFAKNAGGADQWELFQTILPEEDQSYGNPSGGAFGDGLAYSGDDLFIGSERGVWYYRRNQDGQFVRTSTVESGASYPPVESLAFEEGLLVRAGTSFLSGITGGVAVYRRSSTSYTEWILVDATTYSAQLSESCYGQQVLLHGNRVVVTDPCFAPWTIPQFEGRVLVYHLDNDQDSLVQVFARTEQYAFGLSSSIAFDGDTILVGDLPNVLGIGWPRVFEYVPDGLDGYIPSSSYSGNLGFVGGQEIVLNLGHSLHVDGHKFIAGTSTGLAFLQKNPIVESDWTLLRSDTLAGSAQRISTSGQWLAVGMPSVRMVQLYRDISVGMPEAYGIAALRSFPVPASDEVSVVIPRIAPEMELAQLCDGSGRLLYAMPISGRIGILRIIRRPEWKGMHVLKLIDVNGRIAAYSKVMWGL